MVRQMGSVCTGFQPPRQRQRQRQQCQQRRLLRSARSPAEQVCVRARGGMCRCVQFVQLLLGLLALQLVREWLPAVSERTSSMQHACADSAVHASRRQRHACVPNTARVLSLLRMLVCSSMCYFVVPRAQKLVCG